LPLVYLLYGGRKEVLDLKNARNGVERVWYSR